MEKRLSLTIDPSNAKRGANDLSKVLGDLEKKAKTITKALGDLSNVEKFAQSVGKTGEKASKASKQTDEYTLAITKAERAIQANYHSVRLLNGEVGKELELSRKMVTNKKLEFEATSKEAQAVNATTAKTKAYLKIQNDLLKTKEKLALVNTKEYRELQKLRKELDSAERSAKGLDDQSRKLQRTMMGVGIAASMFSGTMIAQDLIQTLDSYTELQNKLAVVTGETNGLASATRELLQVAIDSRTTMNATVDLYSKLVRVNQEYGKSQKEILTITETVSKAVAMSGASAAAAEGAVIQFAQALAGDFKTAGQELNSILEQTPGLAQAIAQGLTELGHLGDVTASQLKRLASEGLLNTQDVMEGLLRVTDQVNGSFARSSKTIAQGMDDVSKAFTVGFGELDKAWALSENIVAGLESVSESLLSTKEAAGALVGFLSGGAVLAAGGTFVALASLISPVVVGIASALAASAALGAALASVETDAEKAAKEFDRVTESLKRFTKASDVAKETTDELPKAVRNQRESILLANITQLEQQRDALMRVGGGDNSETLQDLKQQRDYLIGTLNLAEDSQQVLATTDLIKRLESESANLDALNKELERYNQLLRQARIESAEQSLTDYLFGDDPDAKKLTAYNKTIEMVNKAVKLGGEDWEMYGKVVAKALKILNGEETKSGSTKKMSDDFDRLVKSMKEQKDIIGLTSAEAALYNTEVKAREALERQLGDQLKAGVITQDQYNQKMKEGINLTKGLQEAINAGLANERYGQAVGSASKPSGMLGQLLDTKKFIEDIQKEGGTTTASGNGLLYYQTFEGVSSGIADAITSGDTANLAQSFGSLLGSGVSDAVGKGIASSIGGTAGGLLGDIGGGIAGGLVSSLFQGRKTKQTGSGYSINLTGGSVSSAFSTQSFRRSGGLFSGSRSWTEYEKLSFGAMTSLNNSFALANNTLARQADVLGITVDTFSGKLSQKNGDIAGSIDEFSNKTIDASFAAIESFQYMGETFIETFTRLSEQAQTISDGFKSTGLSSEDVEKSFVESTANTLKSSYQNQITNVLTQIEQAREDAESSVSRYYWKGGKNDGWRLKGRKLYQRQVREAIENATSPLYQDLSELYKRLADVNTEATQIFRQSLLGTIADLNNVNIDDAANKFTELTNSFLDNYYTQEERLQIAADNIAMDFAAMNIEGIDLSTTGEELRNLYENASSPERIAEILSAAKAIAKYNNLLSEQQEIIDSDILDKASKNIDAFLLSLESSYEISIEGINNSLDTVKDSISDLEDVASSLKGIINDSKVESEQLDRLRYKSSQDTLTSLAGKYSPFNPDNLIRSGQDSLMNLNKQLTEVRSAQASKLEESTQYWRDRGAFDIRKSVWGGTTLKNNGLYKGYLEDQANIKRDYERQESFLRYLIGGKVSQIQELESRRGDIPAVENLEEIKKALEGFYSGDTQKFFGNFEDYVRAQSATNNALNIINEATGEQLSTEEQTLKTLEDQLESTKEFYANTQEYYENLLTNSDNQLSILKNIAINGVGDAVIPAFADGGSHSGGLRLVGEAGAEVEYTRPSTIYTNQQSQSMLDMSGVMAEIRALRSDLRAQAAANIRNSNKVRQIMERWEGQGMPADRGF